MTLVNELERFFRYATQQTSHEITLDRPALKRLLDDSAAGLIDTVVVYKVDRGILAPRVLGFYLTLPTCKIAPATDRTLSKAATFSLADSC